jgi:gliding motility-associated lipoprotein GldH
MLLSVASCAPDDNYYSQFYTIEDSGWNYADSLVFTPEPSDSIIKCDLLLSVRHDNKYRYSNLWLELSSPVNDSIMHRDTINVRLADVYGTWLGKGAAVSYNYTDTVYRNLTVVRGRPFIIKHIMRPDTVTIIERIGLIFEPKQ